MKKLLIMLMVIAIAAFLFVGCIPGVTPVDEDEEDEEPVVPTTVAPIITGVPDIVGGYVNAAVALNGIVVNGTAQTYSEVKVYIYCITAGTGDSGVNGVFSVVVANADLINAVKVEGAKTLHATATEAGLAESASSNVMNFILDTVTPFIASSVGKSGTAAVYQFVETADSMAVAGVANSNLHSYTGPPFTEILNTKAGSTINTVAGDYWSIPPLLVYINSHGRNAVAWTGEQIIAPFASIPLFNRLLTGIVNWKIEVIQVTDIDSKNDQVDEEPTDIYPKTVVRVYNIRDGTAQDYSYTTGQITSTSWIVGLVVTAAEFSAATHIGAWVLITTTNTAASAGFVDVTFNEAVTGVSITQSVTAGTTWTLFAATNPVANTKSVRSATVARLTENVATMLPTGVFYSVGVSGIEDLAGSSIPAAAPSSDSGVVIP